MVEPFLFPDRHFGQTRLWTFPSPFLSIYISAHARYTPTCLV